MTCVSAKSYNAWLTSTHNIWRYDRVFGNCKNAFAIVLFWLAFSRIWLTSSTVVGRLTSITMSESEPTCVGTATARPSKSPLSSGITIVVALAAPAWSGNNVFCRWTCPSKVLLWELSCTFWSSVYEWIVVNVALAMPTTRNDLRHWGDAVSGMMHSSEWGYFDQIRFDANYRSRISSPFPGAEKDSLAPLVRWALAFFSSQNTPVDSMTVSTWFCSQGILLDLAGQ